MKSSDYSPPLTLDPETCSTDDENYQLVVANPVIINGYCDKMTRQRFIGKVYGTLWLQLMFTSIFIGLCNQDKVLQDFIVSPVGIGLMYGSSASLLIMACALFCCFTSLRRVPFNYLYVIFFTICMSYSIGYVGIFYDPQTLLLAGLSTSGIFSGLTIYAIQTKYDYTSYGGIGIAMLLGLIMFGIFTSFLQIQLLRIMYSVGGSLIFSFYIVYDTQLITGGTERKIQYTVDDFALASVNLYLDITNLFLLMLNLLSGRN